MDRLRLGLWLLPVAGAVYLVATLAQGVPGFTLALLLLTAGWAAAAWAVPSWNRVVGVLGLVAAALGVAMVYHWVLWDGLPSVAGGLVILGCLVTAAGCGMTSPPWLVVGLSGIALGALLWVITDNGNWSAEAGDAFAVVGSILAATGASTREEEGGEDAEP